MPDDLRSLRRSIISRMLGQPLADRSTKKSKHVRRHALELLEDRRLLAFTVAWDATSGHLSVSGTSGPDNISVAAQDGNVLVNGIEQSIFAASVNSLEVAGRAGHDLLDLGHVTLADFIGLGSGRISVDGGAGNDTLIGTNLNDVLEGGAGSDSINGRAGNDMLLGGSHPDFIQGGMGDDTIVGGGSNDSLYGDSGSDTLMGNGGNDLLSGGLGSDLLAGDAGSDLLLGGPDEDVLEGGLGQDSIEFLDDLDASVSFTDAWKRSVGNGLNDVQRVIDAGAGEQRAEWTFTALPVDTYEVFVTWETASSFSNLATNAPVSVFGGTAGPTLHRLDQTTDPIGFYAADRPWQSLGLQAITAGELTVQLSNDADGRVIADAVRIVPQKNLLAGTRLQGPAAVRGVDGTATYQVRLDRGVANVQQWHIDWGDGSSSVVDAVHATWTHEYQSVGDYEIKATAVTANTRFELPPHLLRVNHERQANLFQNGFLNAAALPSSPGRHDAALMEGWDLVVGTKFETIHIVTNAAATGQNFLVLSPWGAERVGQTISTIPGKEYYLAFDHVSHSQVGRHGAATLGIVVSDAASGHILTSEYIQTSPTAAAHGLAFVASGNSTNVHFLAAGIGRAPDVPLPETERIPDPEPDPDPDPEPHPGIGNVTLTEVAYVTFENVEIIRDNLFRQAGLHGDRSIVKVNGSAGRLGRSLNLGNGARLTLWENGDLSYDPVTAGRFQYLAAGESAYQTISYLERLVTDQETTHEETKRLVIRIDGVNNSPTASHISLDRGILRPGEDITLALEGATDVDGHVAAVGFYRDANADGTLSGILDEFLGFDVTPHDDWTVDVAAGDWEFSPSMYFAVPYDDSTDPADATAVTGAPVRFDLYSVGERSAIINPVGVELLENGDFELPPNTSAINYRRNAVLPGWNIAHGAPALEIQRERQPTGSTYEWADAEGPGVGNQWAELDSTAARSPLPPLWDEVDASTTASQVTSSTYIYQDVRVDRDLVHELSFAFAARPEIGFDNHLRVEVLEPDPFDPNQFTVVRRDNIYSAADDASTALIDWTRRTLRFTPHSETVRIAFSDVGDDNQLGTFLDDVQFSRVRETKIEIESSVTAIEGYREVAIDVQLAAGEASPTEDVIVHYRTESTSFSDSAVPRSDYYPVANGTAVLAAGTTSTQIMIELIDDEASEPDEYFSVVYYVENGAVESGTMEYRDGTSTDIVLRSGSPCLINPLLCDCQPDDPDCEEGGGDPTQDDPRATVSLSNNVTLREASPDIVEGPIVSMSSQVGATVRVYLDIDFGGGHGNCDGVSSDYQMVSPMIFSNQSSAYDGEFYIDIAVTDVDSATSIPFRIRPLDDSHVEGTENFRISITDTQVLSSDTPVDVNTSASIANITVTDDDDPIAAHISVTPATVKEGNDFTFRVSVDQLPAGEADVTVTLSGGDTSPGNDYAGPTTQTVTFGGTNDPSLFQEFTISALDDGEEEDAETFSVQLSTTDCRLTVGTAAADATIASDAPMTVSIKGGSVYETDGVKTYSDSSNPKTPVRVSISERPAGDVTVSFSSKNASAVSPADHVAVSGSVTFTSSAGSPLSFEIPVTINGDTLQEWDENFIIKIDSVDADSDNVEVANGMAQVLIKDDDGTPDGPQDGDQDEEVDDCTCGHGFSGSADPKNGTISHALQSSAAGVTYNSTSHLTTRGITTDRITLPANSGAPSFIEVFATHAGGETEHKFIDGSNLSPGDAFNVSLDLGLQDNLSTAARGYDYELNYIAHYELEQERFSSAPVKFRNAILWDGSGSRDRNAIAPGFGFAFLQQLVLHDNKAYLIAGDRSVWEYTAAGGRFQGNQGVDSEITRVAGWHQIDRLLLPPGWVLPDQLSDTAPKYVVRRTSGTRHVFDADGRHLIDVDSHGNVTQYRYDESGLLQRVIDSYARATEYEYHDGRLKRITDSSGRVTKFSVHQPGDGTYKLIISYEDSSGTILNNEQFWFDEDEHLTLSDTVAGYALYDYDPASGLLTAIRQQTADGQQMLDITSSLSASLIPAAAGTETNPWAIEYPAPNHSGTYAAITDARGYTTEMWLDIFGNVLTELDALGNETHYTRDEDGRVLQMYTADPDHGQSSFLVGDGPIEGAGPDGMLKTSYDYDDRGNLRQITYADGATEQWFYDTQFNVATQHIDELGRRTSYGVDPETGFVVSTRRYLEVSAAGASIHEWQNPDNIYDVNDDGHVREDDFYLVLNNLNTVVYADSNKVLHPRHDHPTAPYFDVNDNGVIEPMDPLAVTNSLSQAAVIDRTEYTTGDSGVPAGLVAATIDPAGRRTEYVYYDDAEQLHSFGRLHKVRTPTGNVEYRYDEHGRLQLSTDAFNVHTGYAYDDLGRQTKVTIPFEKYLSSDLTPAELAAKINWNHVTEYSYLGDGRIDKVTDVLGLVTQRIYDTSSRRLTEIVEDDGHQPASTKYVYDVNGNLQIVIDPLGRETTYHYDALQRQIAVVRPHASDPNYNRWQNPVDPRDVNADGVVDVVDSQLVADFVDANDGPTLNSLLAWPPADGELSYYDVNGDGQVSQSDYDNVSINTRVDRPHTQTVYDNAGNIIAEIDARGSVTQYRYDERHRRTHVIQDNPDPSSDTTLINLSTLPNPNLHTTEETQYDTTGQVERVLGPRAGQEISFTYDAAGRILTQETSSVLDAASGTNQRPQTTYRYDPTGNVVAVTDPLGNTSTRQYDRHTGLLSQVVAPAADELSSPQVTEYVYDHGRLSTTIDHSLYRMTTQTYDKFGNLQRLLAPRVDYEGDDSLQRFHYTYDMMGHRLSERSYLITPGESGDGATTVAMGDITEYQYDQRHRLEYVVGADPASVVNPNPDLDPTSEAAARPVTHLQYDVAGQRKFVTDPDGRTTEYRYDHLGRAFQVVSPDPDANVSADQSVTTYVYDANSNLIADANGENEESFYEYDRLNRIMKETRPNDTEPENDYQTIYGYDLSGNRDLLIDADGNEWAWNHDLLNRVDAESTIAGQRYYQYDLVGNLRQQIDRNGRVTLFAYDDLYRLRDERWFANQATADAWHSGSTSVDPLNHLHFTHDVAGRMTGSADRQHTYTYEYDDLNRVRRHTASVGAAAMTVFEYSYDGRGNRDIVTAASSAGGGFVNDYTFDNLSRQSAVSQFAGDEGNAADKLVEYTYELSGRTRFVFRYDQLNAGPSSGPIVSEFRYDNAGRLDLLQHAVPPSGGTIQSYAFGYDRANRLDSFLLAGEDFYGESVQAFDYNLRSELTAVDRPETDKDERYEYDENGNRLLSGGTDAVTVLNRLEVDDEWNFYEYDAEGNRTTKSDSGSYTEYDWDHRNRLTEIKVYDDGPGSMDRALLQLIRYDYDANNQLIARHDRDIATGAAEAHTYFAYDQGQVVLELDQDDNSPAELTNVYLWGAGVDQLLAADNVQTGELRWALADHQGTIRDWVDANGNLIEHWAYDSFGNITGVTDATGTAIDISDRDSFFAYTGRLYDQTAELQNNLNRWYDSKVGRWISEDPIGFYAGDSNLYRYVGNSPTNATDPTGLVVEIKIVDVKVPLAILPPTIGGQGFRPSWRVGYQFEAMLENDVVRVTSPSITSDEIVGVIDDYAVEIYDVGIGFSRYATLKTISRAVGQNEILLDVIVTGWEEFGVGYMPEFGDAGIGFWEIFNLSQRQKKASVKHTYRIYCDAGHLRVDELAAERTWTSHDRYGVVFNDSGALIHTSPDKFYLNYGRPNNLAPKWQR